MILDIDTDSAVPPYDQVRAQLTSLITTGALPAGSRLPAIRQLAGDLGLAPGTVASRGRHGTRVTDGARVAGATHTAQLDEAAAAYAAAATRSGSNLDQAVAALRLAFAQMTATTLDQEATT